MSGSDGDYKRRDEIEEAETVKIDSDIHLLRVDIADVDVVVVVVVMVVVAVADDYGAAAVAVLRVRPLTWHLFS